MSAKVLPFMTRDEFDNRQFAALPDAPETPLTEQELHRSLIEMSYGEMNKLINRYKSTGKWNQTANNLMRRVMDDVNAVCAAVAGVRTNGQTPQTSHSNRVNPAATISIGPGATTAAANTVPFGPRTGA